MKPIYEGEVIEVIATENGLAFSYCEKKEENQLTVAFKLLSFESGKITNVAKNIYQLSKFGTAYKAFSMQAENYITCKVITFPGEQMLILETNGTIKILDTDSSLLYEGKLNFVGEAPSGIALFGDKLWCSYKNKNVLVRYSINTMREELRIGGGRETPFNAPTDILVDGNYAYVCSSSSSALLKVDLNTYALDVYKEFDTPLKQYLRVNNFEFVVNQNGIYMI